jgi:serine/threonine-protein kinase HipA
VPRFWTRTSPEGLRLLAVERFDRRGGRPMHLESLFSLLNVASANRVLSATGGSYQEVAQVLGLQDPVASSEPAKDRREMFKRFCMALLTGNGDMHGENMAVLVGPRGPRLAPVYDPAPMRAYAQHDMYSALPWMRGDARPGFGLPGDLAERLERLSSTFGVRRSDHISILGLCLEGTADYLDRVDGLQDVPEARKVSLRRAVEPVRYRLQRHYEEMAEPVAAGPTP